MPKGGEVGMKTAQETSRVATTQASSPAALPDMEGWVEFARRDHPGEFARGVARHGWLDKICARR